MVTHRDYVCKTFDAFLQLKEKELLPGKLVLDVGCRNECMRDYFEKKGFTWMGVDSHPASDQVATGKMEALPYGGNTFDIVFVCHAFEHCERPVEALREFKRVLRPGGFVFIATPNPNQHHILKADPDHIMCLNEMQMLRLMVYTGFKDSLSCLEKTDIPEENNYNIITWGKK